jgi:hypothetical protein
MSSKTKGTKPFWTALLITTSMSISGCGMLGSKDKPEAASNVGAGGCLNDSKNLVNRYISGEMEETEWKKSIDCVNESLDFFTDYVRGTTQDAYTQSDMYTLVSRFLITNRPIHTDLLRAAFSLKGALFGGTSSEFTKEEVDVMKSALVRLRDITAELIPYLKLRQKPNPTNAELLDMVAAFKRSGDQLADFVNTLPVGTFSEQALTTLLNELTTSLDLPVIENLGDLIMLSKWMAFNSRRDAIESTDWAEVFRIGLGAGGILLAYKTAVGTDPNDPRAKVVDRLQNDYKFREFMWQLALEAKPYITQSLERHGGVTPFPLFDHIIDELPAGMLDNIPKQTMKQTLRPLFRKFLNSGSQIGVDTQMIDTIFNLFGTVVHDLGMLDRFYESTGIDHYSVTVAQMTTALNQYAASLANPDDQKHFKELQKSILNYQPMLYRDTGHILYADGLGYSKLQNFVVLGMEPIARHIAKTYGSGPDYFIESDLTLFFKDYTDILFALKMVDPTVSDFGPKRLRDMDLFTPIGDGNGQANVSELVHYAMMIISAGELTTEMRNEISGDPATGVPGRCSASLGVDLMGWNWVAADCFRSQFHKNLPHWLDYFPRVKAYWATLTPQQQEQAMVWLEHGSRRNGYSQEDFGKFDISAMATILHYAESLFTRFDVNKSEVLTKSEIATAFPVFKTLLAKKANMAVSKTYILKGIFTYIVKYRSMPVTTGIGPIAKLGWWLAIYTLPTTNYSADRTGVFNIICQLAAPESAAQSDLTPTICAP